MSGTTCLLIVPESLRMALPTEQVASQAALERTLEAMQALLEDVLITHTDRLHTWQRPSENDRQWSGPSPLDGRVMITLFLKAGYSIAKEGVELELSVDSYILAVATILLGVIHIDPTLSHDPHSVN